MKSPEKTHRVAVMRGGGIGDTILALPALQVLRSRFPDTRITLIGSEWHRQLLRDRHLPFDEVVVLPDAWEHGGVLVEAFNQRLRMRDFDLAVQMHGGGRNSNALVLSWGADLTVGMATADAPPLDRTVAYRPWQHEVLRFLDLVMLLDEGGTSASATTLLPSLPLTAAEADAEALDLLVVHPGATDPRRRWSPQNFAGVIRATGLPSVLIGSEDEGDLCAAVAAESDAVNLCGALDLTGMIRLLAHSRLVLANDSGPRHVAEAVGTPTVSIFWIGNLINAGPLRRDHHLVEVSWQVACPSCGATVITHDGTGMPRCGHTDSWVDVVPVESVEVAVRQAWNLSEDVGPHRQQVGHQAGR